MFVRTIIHILEQWRQKPDRKPLILRGARQVGKTTAVRIFSQTYDQYVYLDLEKSEDMNIFDDKLPFRETLQAIFLSRKKTRIPGKTLLFIDEIQNSPRAISMMRYFHESAGDIHVIAAGSLLEAMIGKQQVSFPVGRVEYIFMYPLTFEEYLVASGEDQLLKAYRTMPFPDFAFSTALRLFHQYCLIGGMPEVVQHYLDNEDIVALTPVYQGLMTSYLDDVSKYARNNTMIEVIRHAIETSPFAAGQRIKFHGFGNSHYRSREMGEALRILERAMLLHLVYPTTAVTPPIASDKRKSPRLQFLDTGLINYAADLQNFYFKMDDLNSFYKGILAEHIVGQELLSTSLLKPGRLSFWVRENRGATAEVDFVITCQSKVVPVEVKSGKSGTLRSLHQFVDRSDHRYAIRLYAGPLEKRKTRTPAGKPYILLNIPYFLAGKLRDYAEWMTE